MACASTWPRCWAATATGNVLVEPPVVEMIAEDGVLADTKLIAEPWDAAGLYQVGRFPFGRRWSRVERPISRRRPPLLARRPGHGRRPGHAPVRQRRPLPETPAGRRATRSTSSPATTASRSGTWSATTSKHNEANGEDNRDGIERQLHLELRRRGRTDDPEIQSLRRRQAKNLMATLMLSQGVPMILAGDEFLRTQNGNNNAWCQDNEITWVDWSFVEKNADFLRFTGKWFAAQTPSRPAPPQHSSAIVSARQTSVRN